MPPTHDHIPRFTFSEFDAALLYSIPKPATDLGMIIRCFTFINRGAPPSYADLEGCLTKALQVGIIRKAENKFLVQPDWYARIHIADDTAPNEIESLLAFEETFVNVPFERINDVTSGLIRHEYKLILQQLKA